MKIYAKIEDGKIVYPVVKNNIIKENDITIINPKYEHYIKLGYEEIEINIPENKNSYELVIINNKIKVNYTNIIIEEEPFREDNFSDEIEDEDN